MAPRIFTIGDAMVDIVVHTREAINDQSDTQSSISIHGGGSAANVASWLAHAQADSHFIGVIGDDMSGKEFQRELIAYGVTPHLSIIEKAATGMVVVLVNSRGERTMFPDPGANAQTSHLNIGEIKGASAIFLSGYTMYKSERHENALHLISRIREFDSPLFFDPASVGAMQLYGREQVRELITCADFLILNEDEARYITEEQDVERALEGLRKFTCNVIIKCGPEGAIAIDQENRRYLSPSRGSEVLDTTGAGDAFAAGFIASWVEKRDIQSALDTGNQCGAECVAIIGARPRVNTR